MDGIPRKRQRLLNNSSNMSIGKQLASNVLWKNLEQFSVLGIQILCTFIMAHFLSPSDYGIINILIIFTGFANIIIDSGFGQAIIREKEVTPTDYSTVLYFNLAISIILYFILYFSSGFIADFFKQPVIEELSKITFLILPLNALCIVQSTMLVREIRFKKLCIITLAASLLASAIAIYIAYRYRNIWALVIQNLLTYFFRCLFLWVSTTFKPVIKFSTISLKRYFKFSKNLLVSSFIGCVFNNIYSVIIGRSFSAVDLGFYSQADRIKNACSHTTTQVIQSVTYPILTKIDKGTGELKEGYKKIIATSLIFVGFIMVLFMGCACDLFELLMGDEKWRVTGTFFMLLGINGILYPLHSINQNILMVKGKSKTILFLEITRRIIMITIIAISMQFDIKYFVFSLSVYSFLLLFLNLYYCGKPINYSVTEQLKDTLPIYTRLAIIFIVTYFIGEMLSAMNISIRVLVSLLVGGITGLIIFWNYRYFKASLALLKSIIKK